MTVDLHALDALPGAKPRGTAGAPARRTRRHSRRRSPRPLRNRRPAKPAGQRISPCQPRQPRRRPARHRRLPPPAPAAPQVPRHRPATPTPPAATLPTAPPSSRRARADRAAAACRAGDATATAADLRYGDQRGERRVGGGLAGDIRRAARPISARRAPRPSMNLVQAAPAGDGTSFNVVAYAAGTPEDPSTARRLSLARALGRAQRADRRWRQFDAHLRPRT